MPSGVALEGLTFQVDAASTVSDLRAEILADGWVMDTCDETNDQATWRGSWCR